MLRTGNLYERFPAWSSRQAIGLSAIALLEALVLATYALLPPVEGTPRLLDASMAALTAIVGLSAPSLVPRWNWTFDVLLALCWATVAAATLTRPTASGQVVFGTLLLAVAIYAAYFTSGLRFGLHLFGMVAAYVAARLATPISSGTYFGFLSVAIVLFVALVVHDLRSTDRRYRMLVDNTTDVILQIRRGEIEWVSPSVAGKLGWTASELPGLAREDLWHPDDLRAVEEQRNGSRRGEASSIVVRIRHKDGHYVWIESQVKPMPASGDSCVSTWRDISDRMLAEQSARRFERLQTESIVRKAEASETRTRLFQNISHELRTPLAILSGPLHELQHHGDLTNSERASLAAAMRASARMERLVDGLLDLSQGQPRSLSTIPEPTDLGALTRGGVEMFNAMAGSRDLSLATKVSGVPPLVMIDPEAWMTILVNLVSNALKFTNQGGVVVEVDYDDTTAHLVVRDTGVGIPPHDLPKVFDRYEQSVTRPVHGEAGSGIGLAVVQQLLDALNGRTEIRSTPDEGTTVEVWMPAPPCRAATIADSAHHLDVAARKHAWAWTTTASSEPEVAVSGAQRGRILVVEDNADLRAYLDRLLREAGWDVTAVADAETASGLVSSHDLLLADVMLPGASGVDLVRRVREADDHSGWLPVILLTARADSQSVLSGLAAGADDYVTKPFSPAELLARIGNHVELSFLRQIVLDEAQGRADNLERALGSNRAIGTALGIIMATERVSADEAFSRLRSASQHSNRKLRDVADEVIYTGAVPDSSMSGGVRTHD